MKIGIEGQRLYRKNKHGMDMVVLELIKQLQLIDRKNEYVVFVHTGEDNTSIPEASNFKIVELGGGAYPYWEQVILPRAVRAECCDILHCTSNTGPVVCKTPMILTLHDIIYLEHFSLLQKGGTWYQKFGNTYRRLIVPSLVKKARKVVTVSDYESGNIKKRFGLCAKLSVIPNGVGEHFKRISDPEQLNAAREKFGLPKKFLFFLGNTDPKKNMPNVLKAFALFSSGSREGYKLVMPDIEESRLLQVLKDIGHPEIRQDIVMTGYVPNAEMPLLINLCDVFLYPSLRESFGLPILEGMACGVPVITSNTSSMPEIAGDAALLVDPERPEQIAAAIQKVLEDKALASELINKGLERVSLFSWKKMAEQYQQLYCEMYAQLNNA